MSKLADLCQEKAEGRHKPSRKMTGVFRESLGRDSGTKPPVGPNRTALIDFMARWT